MNLAQSLSSAVEGDEELLTEQQVFEEFGIPKKTLQAKRLSGGGLCSFTDIWTNS